MRHDATVLKHNKNEKGTSQAFVENARAVEARERLSVRLVRDIAMADWAAEHGTTTRTIGARLPPMRTAFTHSLPLLSKRLAGRIVGVLETIKATRLWERAGPQRRAQLLVAGGPGVGTVWTARPDARELAQ